MLADAWEVGPNILAIVVLVIGAINTYLLRQTKQVAADTNQTVKKELTSDDGTTLRDATDRIESSLGTTPLLPADKRHYDATDGSHEPKETNGQDN